MKRLLLIWCDDEKKITHELEVFLPPGYPIEVPDDCFIIGDDTQNATYSIFPRGGTMLKEPPKKPLKRIFDRKDDTDIDEFKKELRDEGIDV